MKNNYIVNFINNLLKNEKKDDGKIERKFENYVLEYLNENEYRKKERTLKKYNMLAYKKLLFDYYPSFRDGNFQGVLVSSNKDEGFEKYELSLPTDKIFSKMHGDIILHYTVYFNNGIVMLENITPDYVLTESELTKYKEGLASKSSAEKDMFKINLLNMMDKK